MKTVVVEEVISNKKVVARDVEVEKFESTEEAVDFFTDADQEVDGEVEVVKLINRIHKINVVNKVRNDAIAGKKAGAKVLAKLAKDNPEARRRMQEILAAYGHEDVELG